MTAPKGIKWDEIPLGRYHDGELARRLMTTRQAVCLQRNARGIPPFDGSTSTRVGTLSAIELKELRALDDAVASLLDERARMSFKICAAVALVVGWRAEPRYARQSGGEGRDSVPLRATTFRFQRRGSRQWSSWLNPHAARGWLLQQGWVDEAKKRIDELRASTHREVRA